MTDTKSKVSLEKAKLNDNYVLVEEEEFLEEQDLSSSFVKMHSSSEQNRFSMKKDFYSDAVYLFYSHLQERVVLNSSVFFFVPKSAILFTF